MSTATAGRAREHTVSKAMQSRGWSQIARSAGSKGAADLIMAHPMHGVALVQVGTSSKSLGPADRTRLLDAAWLCSALPIVATVNRGRIVYREVVDGPPSTWKDYQP